MKTSILVVLVVGLVLAVICLTGFALYNNMVMKENAVDKAWSDVQSAYQRRLDTVPKFVETAKFSVEFQKELALEYADHREKLDSAAQNKNPGELETVANEGMTALVIAVRAEAVPEAKVEQLTELNAGIDNAERVINHQRDVYNDVVRQYNNAIETVPGAWFAPRWGFYPREGFVAQQEAQVSPPLNLTG